MKVVAIIPARYASSRFEGKPLVDILGTRGEPGGYGPYNAQRAGRAQGSCHGRGESLEMKLLVIGLDGAAPEILFGDDRLANFRRLMELGCYGRLESVVPATAVPAWMCLAASQDPGSLGAYGFCMLVDHSYADLRLVGSNSTESAASWDHLARAGKRSIIIE